MDISENIWNRIEGYIWKWWEVLGNLTKKKGKRILTRIVPIKENGPHQEVLQPLNLTVNVVSLKHKTSWGSNMTVRHYPNDDKEWGTLWNDHIIECQVTLTGSPLNAGYRLQRLVMYTQNGDQASYEAMIKALSGKNPVTLRIDRETIRKRVQEGVQTGFLGEDPRYYDSEDTSGEDYMNDPYLQQLRSEIRKLDKEEFNPASTAVNLQFVEVIPQS